VAFVPSGSSLAAGIGDSSIRLWDVTDGRELRVFSGHSKIVRTVAFSPDGHTVASGGEDHSIALWDVASGRRLRTLGQHSDIVESVVFAPDGHLLASASRDGVKLWNLDNSRELRTLVGHNDWVYSVAFSPDGHTLASGGADATVRLWNVANGRELRKLTGHFDPVYAIAISPDGRTLASGSVDQNIKLWDLAKGRELRTLRGHSGYVASVAFSPDGRELVSASSDNSIKLWDVDRGVELRTFAGHTGALSVTYSSDGRTVASAGADREIHLWNPDTGQQVRQLSGHAGTVWSVAFSPDARMLVSGSRDHTVRLWSATDGHEQASAIAFDDDSVVAITPEGFYDYQGGTAEQNLLVRTGPQLFDVTDVAAFRERFYRPDLVRQSLSGQALPASLAPLSSVRPAPAISIGKLPAQIDRAALNLPVTLVDRGGGVGDVRVTVNGSAVSETKGAGTQIANATGTVSKVIALQLVPGANLISVRAYNADGSMLSEPDTAIVSADYAAKRPLQLHALIVGIDRFRNPDLNLQFAVSDATAVAQMLQRRAAPLFGQVNVELRVTPEKTTRDALLSALAGYRAMPPDDVFLLYVASHGTVDESDPVSRDYYLIPSNIGLTSYEAVRREAISQKELQQLVANIPATKKVLLLDTCQAGALADAFAHAPRGMEEQRAINILSRAVGATVLSASTNQEQALEGKDGHGVFTWVVLQALDGKADLQRNGYVTTLDLADYVSDQVPKVAEQIFRREQFPVLTNSGQPFPIVSSK
jgi:WD40 repeat protein